MSAIEKLFVQIFEKKKRIIDQAHRQCQLFDQHLVSKLLIDGIVPPPWLANPMLASFTSDPKDLNEDDLIFGALFSRAQSTIPISDRRFSRQGNVVATTDDGQPQSGLHSELHALNGDIDAGDGLSNLPDCSVNNVGRSSFSAPEMDSTAISPQIQMESRISHSYNDPAVSLAKLQRSKSRQRALELRHSAKADKSCLGDDNNTGVCARGKTGSATSELAKVSNTNIQSCAAEEVKRGECLTQRNHPSNYSGRVTRSRRLALKPNSSNVISSSKVKENGPQSNNVIKRLEPVNAPCFSNGSCEAKETNKGDCQRRETEDNAFSKRVTRSRSANQTKCDNELLTLESALAGGNRVEVQDSMQPLVNTGLTIFSKNCDCENECQRKATKDGDCCSDKQESKGKIRGLPGSFFQSSNEDALMHGSSLKSIGKSTQSPQPSVSQRSQPPAGCFHCEKAPDLCAAKVKTNEGKSNSVSNIFVDKSSICSHSAALNSYRKLEGTEIAAGRSFSSEKDCKLDTEVAAAASCGNTRAATTSTTEGSLRPVSSSNLDSTNSGRRHSTLRKSLLEKSLHTETVVAEKSLNTRENEISGANVTHSFDDRSAGTVAKVAAEFDVLVDKDNACLGSSPKVGLGVSVSRLPPSNFVKSVKPKQLDFDNVEKLSMNRIPGADLKAGGQDVPPDKGTLTMLAPGYLDDKVTSLVCQEKCNFSIDTQLLGRQEATVREDGAQMKSCESHSEETDVARKARNIMSSKLQSFLVQKELRPHTSIGSQNLTSSTNRLIPSQTACQKSSESFPKAMASKLALENICAGADECGSRIIEDTCSTAVTDSDPLGIAVQTVTDLAVGSAAAMDESNISLTNPGPSSGIRLHKKDSLSRGKWFNDEKDAGFSRKLQIPKNSTGSFACDMDHSCPQLKRRKIESQAERSLTASPRHLEKQHESSNGRLVSGNFDNKDNQEASTGVQYLRSHQEDAENSHVSDRTAEEMQNTEGYHLMEGSSLEVKSDQKFNLDGRDRSGNALLSFTGESFGPCLTEQGSSNSYNCLTEKKVATNSCGFGIGSSKQCTIDKLDAEGSSSGRIYLGETAMLLEGSSVSQGIQRSDLIGADETAPEIEGFIIQPDEAQPCTEGDQIELEKANLSSDTDEYSSILERLSSSTFVHSPFCSSSNPFRLPKILDLYQSLPNGLVEGMMGMRTSLPVNGESGKSFSDCLPNCKSQSTWDIKKACVSPIQTLWDRINSKYGSSGKRESSKPELPCIDEENEAAEEIANTIRNRIRPERTTGSIMREPLAEITDNAKPSLVSQDDILADGYGLDSVARDFSFCGTNNQEKQKPEKCSAGGRRFTGKGKENRSIFRGTNHARRTTESLRNRSSRPKLSGKNGMNKGPAYPGGKSSCSNIVSNITSFIPLVQQKQAAEVITGKRDIKVKALEAAEAAKRMAEKKENERKMKKEALRLERERIEQDNRRQLELQNRKKEEERKKREAEMAAKKRQREEEERIEKERKRKRVEEAKQREEEGRREKEKKRKRVEEAKGNHQEREKICAKKEEKETKCCDAVNGKNESKECIDGREKCNNLENNREGNMKIPLAETFTSKNPMTDETKESLKHSEAVNDCGKKEKIIANPIKGTENDVLIAQNTIEGQSYDISPYKGSDDEDEDDDDRTDNNKFVPSWASKQRLYLTVSSQKLVAPETIFPLQSFCNISEVLLPRKLQGK